MRELYPHECVLIAGGEVGATGMGDNVSYTGVYPECEIAGKVAEVFTMGLAELSGRAGGLIADGLDLPEAIADRVVQECVRTHGDSFPSIPPSAGGGSSSATTMIGGDGILITRYGF